MLTLGKTDFKAKSVSRDIIDNIAVTTYSARGEDHFVNYTSV